MKAAIYCRVSTDNQEKEGTSLQTQLENCLAYCQGKGYEATHRFSEAYSGLSLERPELDRLRELARSNVIDVIVCHSLDRLSRDPVHGVIITQELEKHGVALKAVTETVDSTEVGKLITYIRGFASKLEAEKIRERTMRGKRERIRQGKLPTGRGILYGYDYDKERGINTANSNLETVRMIGQWVIQEGISLNEVCRRLMRNGIPAPKGGHRWSRGTVGRIMRNPAYVGKSYASKTRTEDRKRVICSEADHVLIPNAVDRAAFTWDEWDLIQKQLDRNRELSPRNQKLSYLLSGKLFCKTCGRKYYGVPMHGKAYYRCSGRIGLLVDKRCTSKTVNASKLDGTIWAEIVKILKQPRTVLAGLQLLEDGMNQEALLENDLDCIRKKLKALDREQEQLLQWALKGFPESIVIKDNEKLNRERARLQCELSETEQRLEKTKESHINVEKLDEFCKIVSQKLEDFSYAEKKSTLEMLKVKVWTDGYNPPELQGILPIPNEVRAMSQPL